MPGIVNIWSVGRLLLLSLLRQATHRRLDEACLTGNRRCLDRYPATATADFLAPSGCAVILAD